MPQPNIDPTKLGTMIVSNGVVKWTPKPGTRDADAAIIRDSVRELNRRLRAGELIVDSKGKVTDKNGGQ